MRRAFADRPNLALWFCLCLSLPADIKEPGAATCCYKRFACWKNQQLLEPNRPTGRTFDRGATMRNPLIAGTLSLLIPGLGQIYNGRILFGLIWLLVFGISWIGSVGFFGLIVHVISAWCAYSYAKDHPIRI